MFLYCPAGHPGAGEISGAEKVIAQWSAHVPDEHLTCEAVLPQQVRRTVTIAVHDADHRPAGHARVGKKGGAKNGVAERSTHVPREHLTGDRVLPEHIGVAVAIQVAHANYRPSAHR